MKSGLARILALVLVAAVVIAGLVIFTSSGSSRTLTADFPRTVSLYAGSDVRILGVKVGSVQSVVPEGTKVVVKMSYDPKYKVPANAKAVIISPSVVGDRFVQLTPAYTSGAQMPDNAVLGLDRTAVPLELDQIFGSLNDLSIALGPDRGGLTSTAAGRGALTRLLDSTARNFGGQGAQFNTMIHNVGALSQTLDNNKDNLFGASKQLEVFVNALVKNDSTVRQFNDSLASVSSMLAGDRNDLAAAVHNLGIAMTTVRGFVHDNRAALSRDIVKLDQVVKIVVRRRASLDEVLRTAPLALNNLGLLYDKRTNTLLTRANIGSSVDQLKANPAAVICDYLAVAPNSGQTCASVLKNLPRTAPFGEGQPTVARPIDRTLGGLLEASR